MASTFSEVLLLYYINIATTFTKGKEELLANIEASLDTLTSLWPSPMIL